MSIVTRATWAAERVIGAVASGAAKVARAARILPPTTHITQLQTDNQSHWPLPAILNALEEHELGFFHESSRLAAAFGRDDRITACRGTRIRSLVGKNGAKFDILESEDGDQRRTSGIGDRVKRLWFRCFTENVVSRILGDYIDLGVSISRIHWQLVGTEWLPKLEPWDMRWVRWDHFRGCFMAQCQEGEVEVRPDTGEWLIVGGDWMAAGVRALAFPFFFRGMTWKDWARYCEKHGVPILAIDEPPSEQGSTTKSVKDSFFARLKQIGREGILRLPKNKDGKTGYDAKFLEPSTLSWPTFEAFLKRLDTCIAIFLLGQNLSTEVQTGSLAAAIAQNRVRLDYLAADAEALSTAFRSQVLMPWGRFNLEGWNDELAPWPKWDTSEPDDQKSRSTVLVNVSQGLEKLKKNASPIDERQLLESYALPLLSPEDFAKQQELAEKKADEAFRRQQQSAPAKSDDAGKGGKDDKAPAKSDDAEKAA